MTTPPAAPPPPPAQPSAQTMRQLAFIKMFFELGVQQAAQPPSLNITSVLTLHDAAELFLQLVGEHRKVKLPRFIHFHEYFKVLDPATDPKGIALSGEHRMIRLNEVRTAFKHHGTEPSQRSIERACGDVRVFLETNTPLVFTLSFDDIDMAEVIPQEAIRNKVRAASAAAASGDLIDAMGLLAEAYDELFEAGSSRRRIGRFGDTIRPMTEHDINQAVRPCPQDKTRRSADADSRNLARMISDVAEAGAEMQRAMRVMTLGIDYRQFERFQRLTSG